MVQTDEFTKEKFGLSTTEALNRLASDISQALQEFKSQNTSFRPWLRDAFHHSSLHSLFTWPSVLSLLICFTLLCIAIPRTEHISFSITFQILITAIIILSNVCLVIRESLLRYSEIPRRVEHVIHELKEASNDCSWNSDIYPNLCSPVSPCLTLQWTYRDGVIVNLPWALLVRGDILVLRPGQTVPGTCSSLLHTDGPVKLQPGDTYVPAVNEDFVSVPKARIPLKNRLYVLDETAYLRNVKIALHKSLERPNSLYDLQRHTLVTQCLNYYCLMFITLAALLVSVLRSTNLLNMSWMEPYQPTSLELFVVAPMLSALPLLPTIFPVAWVLLNCWGTARLKALLDKSVHEKANYNIEAGSTISSSHKIENVKWNHVIRHLPGLICGSDSFLFRSANVVHVLGSVTALCCVDKKGILSWPNPSAEKVFFLRNVDKIYSSSNTSLNSNDSEVSLGQHRSSGHLPSAPYSQTVPEVLDITHDHTSPFSLQFDDHSWKQYINSLKPLGLSILLNTCNSATQDQYNTFCNHVACQAMASEHSVPVTNRRCLCELAKQIGFQPKAQETFSLHQQLYTYRHLQPDTVRRDIKFARSLHISTKLKVPFPHMVSVVVKESNSGALQLLSQGTADIILDSCTDFWDGQELHSLSSADRKHIMDFYQRSALTAYCTAYAYRPVSQNISQDLGKVYLELPNNSRSIYGNVRMQSSCEELCILDAKMNGLSLSTDSLLYNDSKLEEISDIEGCFEVQCNQIFIGMITMQYQAQADVVELIEQLEQACIRFVHFSKENELRSRVFSEKMGLESGWNCHISLLSNKNSSPASPANSPEACAAPNVVNSKIDIDSDEKDYLLPMSRLEGTKMISRSSPGNINLEHTLVKFSEDTTALSNDMENSYSNTNFNQGSAIQLKNMEKPGETPSTTEENPEPWMSLSCLTDSTEQSAPVNFDMSNRAKLPRGIENIRPHIETVDNVPLLVSLFTDCTADVTREMLQIMQDYGEVVVALGSSSNCDNMPIFNQADCSISIEPLYPQVCQSIPAFNVTGCKGISPLDLGRKLNSISCSISMRREDPVSLFLMICQSRHFMAVLWNAVQFWVSCSVTLSLTLTLGLLVGFPLLWTTGSVMLITFLIIPLLSTSLVSNSIDYRVMRRATGKKMTKINLQRIIFIIWSYGCKFFPVVLAVLATFCVAIVPVGQNTDTTNSTTVDEHVKIQSLFDSTETKNESPEQRLFFAQHMAMLSIILNFIAVSITFVHREYSIWQKSPHRNTVWTVVVTIMFVLQVLYCTMDLYVARADSATMWLNKWISWFVCFTTPVVVYVFSEFIKWQEIKANSRYQRRARLDFGTKLGMNSPF